MSEPGMIALRPEAVKKAPGQAKLLLAWASKEAAALLRQLELKGHQETLSLHWQFIKKGWAGGFASGVVAGYQLAMAATEKLTEKALEQTKAVLDEIPEDGEKSNAAQMPLPLEEGK